MNKNIFISGGSGFIGANLANYLVKKNYKVTVYDNFKSKYLNSNAKFVKGDILDLKKLSNAISGNNIVFHLAGIADIEECNKKPQEAINANIIGTSNILEAAGKNRVKQFMFGSSMYVYNDLASYYSLTKKISEMLIEEFSKKYKINFTFLRYGSLYGPLSQEWNALNRYIKEILNNKSITYYGTGEETREYIHIEDAINLTIKCMNKKYYNKAVIITGQQSISSKKILQMIFEILNLDFHKIKYSKKQNKKFHYNITPYKFDIKEATRIVPSEYIDLGSGLVQLIENINNFKEKK